MPIGESSTRTAAAAAAAAAPEPSNQREPRTEEAGLTGHQNEENNNFVRQILQGIDGDLFGAHGCHNGRH